MLGITIATKAPMDRRNSRKLAAARRVNRIAMAKSAEAMAVEDHVVSVPVVQRAKPANVSIRAVAYHSKEHVLARH